MPSPGSYFGCTGVVKVVPAVAVVHLKQELEALLQRPVDLVRLRERMNPGLRQAILQEGISA